MRIEESMFLGARNICGFWFLSAVHTYVTVVFSINSIQTRPEAEDTWQESMPIVGRILVVFNETDPLQDLANSYK